MFQLLCAALHAFFVYCFLCLFSFGHLGAKLHRAFSFGQKNAVTPHQTTQTCVLWSTSLTLVMPCAGGLTQSCVSKMLTLSACPEGCSCDLPRPANTTTKDGVPFFLEAHGGKALPGKPGILVLGVTARMSNTAVPGLSLVLAAPGPALSCPALYIAALKAVNGVLLIRKQSGTWHAWRW